MPLACEMSKMKNYTRTTYGQPEPDLDADLDLYDLPPKDFLLETFDRLAAGRPRLLNAGSDTSAFVRLMEQINPAAHGSRRGADNRQDRHAVNRLIDGLSDVKSLKGPATSDTVDRLAAALFADAPNFAEAIQTIRSSAMTSIRRGARWLQFKPIIIESDPGAGKTRIVQKLADHSGLPIIYLDCASMTNLTPILGQDSSWSHARSSEVMEGIARGDVANPIVVLDELDKLKDNGRNSSPQASEALVGLFEESSAAAHLDHFSQLTVDMSFINWVILVNDVDRLSRPLVDRCKVVRLLPPSVDEIIEIATREIERRGLEPELVAAIAKAVHKGRLTSLRTLHKLLDAAAAASARPLLN